MNTRRRTALPLIVLLALVLAVPGTSVALHHFTPPVVPVIPNTVRRGDIGRVVAPFPDQWVFESNGDPLGNGNVGWQIFLFDLLERDFAGLTGISQLTFGSYNPRNPMMSRNGEFAIFDVAFEADGGLCADPQNNCGASASPALGRQIFVSAVRTQKIYQITDVAGDCHNPSLSGNGRWLVFESSADVLGDGMVHTVPELYKVDLTQVCPDCVPLLPAVPNTGPPVARVTTGGGTHGVLDGTGKTIAFESRGDLAGGGAHPGTQQIYLVAKGSLTQLTRGTTDARTPSVNSSGTRIAFEWDQPSSTGPMSQIYWAKFRLGHPIVFTQVTKGNAPSQHPSLGYNGRRLTFVSSADLLGQGTQGVPQVFQYRIGHLKTITQYTNVAAGAQSGTSTFFEMYGFVSSADVKGDGNVSPQVFVANPYIKAPPDFKTPFPGTPTPHPAATPGGPISLTLISRAADNGDGTLTGILDATVRDSSGNFVPDGTPVHFELVPADARVTVTDGSTAALPSCDVTAYYASTGTGIVAQSGIAHSCVVYPKGLAGAPRTFSGSATTVDGTVSTAGTFVLHAAGILTPTPTRTKTPTPTRTKTPTRTPTPKKT